MIEINNQLKRKKMVIFLGAAIIDTLILDLVFKYLVRFNYISEQVFVPGVLAIIKHQNYGLIGNAPVPYQIIIILTLAAFAVLFAGMKAAYKENRFFEMLALGYVAGGALGNFVDRVVNGYVFDWILLFNTSIINIADAAITIGIIGYVAAHYYYKRADGGQRMADGNQS